MVDALRDRRPAVGCGSASLGDRLEPAFDLARSGQVDYLVFDRVGELSMARWEAQRQANPARGYDATLPRVIKGMTPFLGAGRIAMGSFAGANVDAAVAAAVEAARACGLDGLAIGAVRGDNVLEQVKKQNVMLEYLGCPVSDVVNDVTSAYAYIGADGLLDALREGAQLVLGGRLADSSPAVAAVADAFGWGLDDWEGLAVGTMTGHLLEGGSGITGGGFADPPYRMPVPGYDPLGFPLALVSRDAIRLGKLAEAAGEVTTETVKSRIVYETQDPGRYLTPDVHLDMSDVAVEQVAPDVVEITGMRGLPRPETYRVIVTVRVGWKAVVEFSYGGPGCLDRARLGEDILRHRFDALGLQPKKLRFDYHGISTLFGSGGASSELEEVRIRLAALCEDRRVATAIAEETALLYFDRPAGMGATKASVEEAQVAAGASLSREYVKIEHELVRA